MHQQIDDERGRQQGYDRQERAGRHRVLNSLPDDNPEVEQSMLNDR